MRARPPATCEYAVSLRRATRDDHDAVFFRDHVFDLGLDASLETPEERADEVFDAYQLACFRCHDHATMACAMSVAACKLGAMDMGMHSCCSRGSGLAQTPAALTSM